MSFNKSYALIGAAGYIAPRHMKAIGDTGGQLVAAFDPNDSIGIIDSYFPDASFFTQFEQFDRHIHNLRRARSAVDFISITSPNYLHDSHMRFAMRAGADAICEKPLVLNPQDIDDLKEVENETGRKVNTILQLRVHPSILSLRDEVASLPSDKKFDVDLSYITSRGNWYIQSWKGDDGKSGGIATNIGVHFFDMLHFLFGKHQTSQVHLKAPTKAAGYLEYERARVRWFMSLDANDLPDSCLASGKRTYRSITIDGKAVEFSDGFTDLHTRSYEEILNGRGFGLEDNRTAIEIVSQIRCASTSKRGEMHPFIQSCSP
tara:strand:- start:3920 stop:4873 length:954 start_codon:yes stop_codon:yes gene_type:complete